MAIDQALPVIAVFGSNSTKPPHLKEAELKAAELVAIEINRAGAVLLTGAEPPPDGYPQRPSTVKDVSIYAARQAASSGSDATWVGVANRGESAPPQGRGEEAVVVTPGWDDRRNFVEAALCDAAFAIGGTSPGTASEVLFSLYLGRRVIVLTDVTSDSDVSPRALKGYIGKRVAASGTRLAVDRGIAGAYQWAETTKKEVKTRPLPADKATAARLVVEMLNPDPKHEPRTDVESLVDEESWDRYVDEALRASGRSSD